jgi:hypothetical protein
MLKKLLKMLSMFGPLALGVYLVWLGWDNLGPRKPEIGPERQKLADQLIPTIIEDIRLSRQDIRQATLLHFANDPTDYFTNKLRSGLEQRGVLDLGDRSFGEKLRDTLRIRHRSYTAMDEAIAKGRDRGAPGVLYGEIYAFESFPGGVKLDVEVNLANVANRQTVFGKRYNLEAPPRVFAPEDMQKAVRSFPWFKRLLGWMIIVLLLPVFTIGFIRTMVRKESNRANAFVLSVYTIIDALIAWLMVGAALNSWFRVAVFIFAVGVAFFYNVRVMTFAMRLEEA